MARFQQKYVYMVGQSDLPSSRFMNLRHQALGHHPTSGTTPTSHSSYLLNFGTWQVTTLLVPVTGLYQQSLKRCYESRISVIT